MTYLVGYHKSKPTVLNMFLDLKGDVQICWHDMDDSSIVLVNGQRLVIPARKFEGYTSEFHETERES